MSKKTTKRGIEEWFEAIEKIYSDDNLREEFMKLGLRSEADAFAKAHKFPTYIINRLMRERLTFIHYHNLMEQYGKATQSLPLEAFILQEEMRSAFFQ